MGQLRKKETQINYNICGGVKQKTRNTSKRNELANHSLFGKRTRLEARKGGAEWKAIKKIRKKKSTTIDVVETGNVDNGATTCSKETITVRNEHIRGICYSVQGMTQVIYPTSLRNIVNRANIRMN